MATAATQGSASEGIADGDASYATVVERHAGDAIRLVLGVVALTLSASVSLATNAHVSPLELDLFRVINDLPSG
jgi:undecaprenyl-diphosphatase